MEWSPDSRYIAFCEQPLIVSLLNLFFDYQYNVYVYSPDGRLAGSIIKKDHLGIKTMKWTPSSQFLALGDYNQSVILYNHLTWRPTVTILHPERLTDKDIVNHNYFLFILSSLYSLNVKMCRMIQIQLL